MIDWLDLYMTDLFQLFLLMYLLVVIIYFLFPVVDFHYRHNGLITFTHISIYKYKKLKKSGKLKWDKENMIYELKGDDI